MSKETNNNRNTLISMMSISEDITRTNNRIYELLRQLMNNPQELTNIKISIDNLYDKITNLKNSDIGTPLVEEEKVMVPGPDDISPKGDVEYQRLSQEETAKVDSEIEEKLNDNTEKITPEPVRKPSLPRKSTRKIQRSTRKIQRNANTRRPVRPLDCNTKPPRPDHYPRPNEDD